MEKLKDENSEKWQTSNINAMQHKSVKHIYNYLIVYITDQTVMQIYMLPDFWLYRYGM